jgi:hypothetical protein
MRVSTAKTDAFSVLVMTDPSQQGRSACWCWGWQCDGRWLYCYLVVGWYVQPPHFHVLSPVHFLARSSSSFSPLFPSLDTTASRGLLSIPSVDIERGKGKYVLVKVTASGQTQFFVRSRQEAQFHADVFKELRLELERLGLEGLKWDILGGGRIKKDNDDRIEIFGHSGLCIFFTFFYTCGAFFTVPAATSSTFNVSYFIHTCACAMYNMC